MRNSRFYKNLTIFLLILNVSIIFNGICFVLFAGTAAKAQAAVKLAVIDQACDNHQTIDAGQKIGCHTSNQLLPCCVEQKDGRSQTVSLTENNFSEQLALIADFSNIDAATRANQPVFYYSIYLPPPEQAQLSSTIIRV